MNDNTILRVEGISKSFPGVLALNDVSIDVKKGEILAILGENGAGKSTLMKILSGLYQPDLGSIMINKNWFRSQEDNEDYQGLELVQFSEPRVPILLGIGQVYQHFQLVGPFTVGENITIGKEFVKDTGIYPILSKIPFLPKFIDNEKTNKEILDLSEEYGLPIDPKILVEDLPVGLKQRTEILKQLFRKAELLILDEPTAVLTPTEVEGLFKTMKNLRNTGKSLIFISHKLKESLKIADRIIVLRKGGVVGETTPEQVNERQLAEMLVGRRLLNQLNRKDLPLGDAVLSVKNLNLYDENLTSEEQVRVLDDINFTVFKNQIVGIVGVQGNGQSELLNCIMGMKQPIDGEIILKSSKGVFNLRERNTLETLRAGVGYIPEDRTVQGLVLDFNLSENSWLAFHGFDEENVDFSSTDKEIENSSQRKTMSPILKRFLLPIQKMRALASRIVNTYEVKTPSIDVNIRSLSGGNQQKVLIGREFAKNPDLIVAAEPTRGVDIGVMEKVHLELIRRRDEGAGILLVSSDLDEILKLADFILVMYEGKIVGQGDIKEMKMSEISELMTYGESEKEGSK